MSKDNNEDGGGLADLATGIVIGLGVAAAAVTAGAAVFIARRGQTRAAPTVPPHQPPIEVEERSGDDVAGDDDVPRIGRGFN